MRNNRRLLAILRTTRVAVCPKCLRVPRVSSGGHLVCEEHGRLSELVLVDKPIQPTSAPPSRHDRLLDGVLGGCEAKVGRHSARRGERCGRPARHVENGKLVCGMHRECNIERKRESLRWTWWCKVRSKHEETC